MNPTDTFLIHITVNGQQQQLPAGSTLADAAQLSQVQAPFAAAVNLQFVPRARYAETVLQHGDQIELISPVTGG